MNGQEATANAFSAFYRMLKPGGVLGVVDHRLPEDADAAREKSSGYVKTSTVIKLAEAAGFKLAGKSEVNANPADTADHPQRSEEHTSELQSLMRISYAVFCLKKKTKTTTKTDKRTQQLKYTQHTEK